jgi:hypothetical protein
MANLGGFNAGDVPPMDNFDAIPAGLYKAIATASENKENKKGTGSYLQIAWEIIEGEFKGRKLWSRLNLQNQSAQAVGIAKKELSSICRAIGILVPVDSENLHNKPLILSVAIEKRADNGEMSNRIKGYAAVGGSAPTFQASAPAPVTQPIGSAPWRK